MNNTARKQIRGIIDRLEEIQSEIEELKENEEEKLGNLPEGLQDSDKGQAFCDAIDALEGAGEWIADALDNLGTAIE